MVNKIIAVESYHPTLKRYISFTFDKYDLRKSVGVLFTYLLTSSNC